MTDRSEEAPMTVREDMSAMSADAAEWFGRIRSAATTTDALAVLEEAWRAGVDLDALAALYERRNEEAR